LFASKIGFIGPQRTTTSNEQNVKAQFSTPGIVLRSQPITNFHALSLCRENIIDRPAMNAFAKKARLSAAAFR
jgi:hypothetical protein